MDHAPGRRWSPDGGEGFQVQLFGTKIERALQFRVEASPGFQVLGMVRQLGNGKSFQPVDFSGFIDLLSYRPPLSLAFLTDLARLPRCQFLGFVLLSSL